MGLGFRVSGLWLIGIRVEGLGFRVSGLWLIGIRVEGFRAFRV